MSNRNLQPRFMPTIVATIVESAAIWLAIILMLTLWSIIGNSPYSDGGIQQSADPISVLTDITQWELVAATMIASVYFTIRLYRRMFPISYERDTKTYVATSYAGKFNKLGLESWFLILIGAAISIFVGGDMNTLILAGAYCIVIQAYNILTTYRCKQGFFGTNSVEAVELIEYVAKLKGNIEPPPSGGTLVPYGGTLDNKTGISPDFSEEGKRNA
jgi:hypothetical protein